MQRLRLLYSSLAGVGLVIVTQLLQVGDELDHSGWLRASTICFAIAIPALAASIYVLTIEVEQDHHPAWKVSLPIPGRDKPIEWPFGIAMLVVSRLGLLSGFAGIAAMFFYFGGLVGGLFFAVSVVTFQVAQAHERRRHNQEAPPSEGSDNRLEGDDAGADAGR